MLPKTATTSPKVKTNMPTNRTAAAVPVEKKAVPATNSKRPKMVFGISVSLRRITVRMGVNKITTRPLRELR